MLLFTFVYVFRQEIYLVVDHLCSACRNHRHMVVHPFHRNASSFI